MNERIQQLLKESTYDVLGVKQVDQKKFAELIVQECAEVCHNRKLTPSTFTGDELLEHFGIKK